MPDYSPTIGGKRFNELRQALDTEKQLTQRLDALINSLGIVGMKKLEDAIAPNVERILKKASPAVTKRVVRQLLTILTDDREFNGAMEIAKINPRAYHNAVKEAVVAMYAAMYTDDKILEIVRGKDREF